MALDKYGIGTIVPTPGQLKIRNLLRYPDDLKTGTTKVVLGHYPEYIRIATDMRACLFQVRDDDFKDLTSSDIWEKNQHFLDQMYHSGAVFFLATPIKKARAGSWFEREVHYLNTLGQPHFHGL